MKLITDDNPTPSIPHTDFANLIRKKYGLVGWNRLAPPFLVFLEQKQDGWMTLIRERVTERHVVHSAPRIVYFLSSILNRSLYSSSSRNLWDQLIRKWTDPTSRSYKKNAVTSMQYTSSKDNPLVKSSNLTKLTRFRALSFSHSYDVFAQPQLSEIRRSLTTAEGLGNQTIQSNITFLAVKEIQRFQTNLAKQLTNVNHRNQVNQSKLMNPTIMLIKAVQARESLQAIQSSQTLHSGRTPHTKALLSTIGRKDWTIVPAVWLTSSVPTGRTHLTEAMRHSITTRLESTRTNISANTDLSQLSRDVPVSHLNSTNLVNRIPLPSLRHPEPGMPTITKDGNAEAGSLTQEGVTKPSTRDTIQAPIIDIQTLSEEVYQVLERKLIIERQRKGL